MRALTNSPSAGITMFIAGLLCILCALVFTYHRIRREIRKVNRPADQAYRDGFEAGYDKGWLEGRVADRPKVVGLRRAE